MRASSSCLLCSVFALAAMLTSCKTAQPDTQESPQETSTNGSTPIVEPEAVAPSGDDDLPPALDGMPEMPEGMLYISYFFYNPGGDADSPRIDTPLVRVPPERLLETLPAQLFTEEQVDHLAPPVKLIQADMQTAYPLGEAAIVQEYGDEANMPGRSANMSCHIGTYSHGSTRCCTVPPSRPAGDTPFEARTADMLWAVICLSNDVAQ